MNEDRVLALLLLLAVAPVALTALWAIARGYRIDVHLNRDDPRDRKGEGP